MHVLNAARMAAFAYRRADVQIGGDALLIEEINGTTYYAFRGTDDGSDWLENIRVRKTSADYPLPSVHRGFYSIACDFNLAVRHPNLEGIVCGHSKGGAIAQLFAAIHDMRCITFAAPKTGMRYNHHTEITRDGDWVPLVPFTYKRIRHRNHLHITRTREVLRNPSTSRMVKGIISSTIRHLGIYGLAALDAHNMENYLRDIELIEGEK